MNTRLASEAVEDGYRVNDPAVVFAPATSNDDATCIVDATVEGVPALESCHSMGGKRDGARARLTPVFCTRMLPCQYDGGAVAQSHFGVFAFMAAGLSAEFCIRRRPDRFLAAAVAATVLLSIANAGQETAVPEKVKQLRLAAEQGNADAQSNLGVMYANGEGVLRSGAAAADWYYKAGLAYLEEGKREDALRCVERIRNLEAVLDLTVPNMFLADQLLRAVYPKN